MKHLPLSLRSLSALSLAVLVTACSSSAPPPSSTDAGPSVPGGHVAIGQLPDIDMAAMLAHTKGLSSDEFEDRRPGSRGEERTVAYLVDEFKKVGLKPGNTDGTYVQQVPLVGITTSPA